MMKRNCMVMLCFIVCAVTIGCGGGGGGSSSDRQFNLVVLDSIVGEGVAINNRGQVLVEGQDTDVVWDYARGNDAITILSSSFGATVTDINDSGHIVGNDEIGAFIMRRTDSKEYLTPIKFYENTYVMAINSLGQVVGQSGYGLYSGVSPGTQLKWDTDGSVRKLSRLTGYEDGTVEDINDSGQSVGDAILAEDTDANVSRAVKWDQNGNMTLLNLSNGSSRANAINNNGVIVGVIPAREECCAALWTPDGRVKNLGVLSGYSRSTATDINDRGWVVGISGNRGEDEYWIIRATCWTPDGGIIDIGKLVSGESGTHSINRDGVIAGWVEGADGKRHPAVWVPVK